MRNKEAELKAILNKYDKDVQMVYSSLLALEKKTKNLRKAQRKEFIQNAIMEKVQENDN